MLLKQLVGGATTGINNQTGTTYTLVKADAGKTIVANNAAAVTVTIPADVFTVGATVEFVQYGAGDVSLVGANGVTLHLPSTLAATTSAQYGTVRIVQVAANVWTVSGNLATAPS